MRHYITPRQYRDGDILLTEAYGRVRLEAITPATDLDEDADPDAHIAWVTITGGELDGSTRTIELAPSSLLVVERQDELGGELAEVV